MAHDPSNMQWQTTLHEFVELLEALGGSDVDDLAADVLPFGVIPPADHDVVLLPGVHTHRAGAIGGVEEPVVAAEGRHLMRGELVLHVGPADPHLQRDEPLGVVALPVLSEDLARVDLRAEELADPVPVD